MENIYIPNRWHIFLHILTWQRLLKPSFGEQGQTICISYPGFTILMVTFPSAAMISEMKTLD